MDKKTLKALQGSIEHWEQNVKGERLDETSISGDDCDLCGLFLVWSDPEDKQCKGCPVMRKTGEQGCQGTPYFNALAARTKWVASVNHGDTVKKQHHRREEFRKYAHEELKFLKGLLPK